MSHFTGSVIFVIPSTHMLLASQNTCPIIVYPVTNYATHLLSESLYGKCYFCDPIYPCAAGLSEYVPYYSLFCGQLYTPSAKLVTLPEMYFFRSQLSQFLFIDASI